MATKISELTQDLYPPAEAVVPVDHGGVTYKTPITNLWKLRQDTTVNFDNTMTTPEMQALIDAVPKDLGGHGLTFQFADGTYTMTDQLGFNYFHSGYIVIQGNPADTAGLNTAQSVHLDFSSVNNRHLNLWFNSVGAVYVYYLKISINSTAGWRGIEQVRSSAKGVYYYNYFLGNGTGDGEGIILNGGEADIEQNYFSNMQYAIQAANTSTVFSRINDDTGTLPAYGLNAFGGIIHKNNTQPTGSTANETTSAGGQIF